MKNFEQFINELSSQSATKPIENSTNVPRYNYMNAADILANKHNMSVTPDTLKEFEDEIVSKMDESEKPENDDYYAKLYKEHKHQELKETPPYSDDKISNSDFGKQGYEDDVKMEMENENKEVVNEDGGVAAATGGNISGMCAVTSAQPSSVPGQTLGSNTVGGSYGNDGIVGSGDIANGGNKNVIKRPSGSRRKNKMKAKAKEMAKNMKNSFKGGEYKQGGDKNATKAPENILSFSDFTKKK